MPREHFSWQSQWSLRRRKGACNETSVVVRKDIPGGFLTERLRWNHRKRLCSRRAASDPVGEFAAEQPARPPRAAYGRTRASSSVLSLPHIWIACSVITLSLCIATKGRWLGEEIVRRPTERGREKLLWSFSYCVESSRGADQTFI